MPNKRALSGDVRESDGFMFDGEKWIPPATPLLQALGDALMMHAAPDGAIDWPQASAGLARMLAEILGPQPIIVRQKMMADFRAELDRSVNLAALRASVITGGKQ